jgi:hypothetical protein
MEKKHWIGMGVLIVTHILVFWLGWLAASSPARKYWFLDCAGLAPNLKTYYKVVGENQKTITLEAEKTKEFNIDRVRAGLGDKDWSPKLSTIIRFQKDPTSNYIKVTRECGP